MKKKYPKGTHGPMSHLVYDEFKDTMRMGVIVVSLDEMTNVFMNLLAEFMTFQKQRGQEELL